jgi:transketolase
MDTARSASIIHKSTNLQVNIVTGSGQEFKRVTEIKKTIMTENKAKYMQQAELDQLSVNTIRFLSVDAVQKANSGHPGMPLDAAPMAYVLWTRFMKYNPAHPHWFDRDRFILSAGHGSMLLYSMLHLTGYDLSLDQIKQFRQWGSLTPGHPESGLTPGVEATTGPLGQGFGNAVGLTIAEAYFAARYNKPGHQLIDHYTYSIVSDGDLMEGISAEAASLAGHLRLGKLICLYDNNHVTLSASTHMAFSDDTAMRFQSYGWHTQSIEDGNDLGSIEKAVEAARHEKERPSLILIRTHLGYGSPKKQDTFEAHGSPLGEEEVKMTKQRLGWPFEPLFYIPGEVNVHMRMAVEKGRQAEDKWKAGFAAYKNDYPDLANELQNLIENKLPSGWDENIPVFPPDEKGIATRIASGKTMNSFSSRLPGFLGGSADLNPSTYTELKDAGNFENASYLSKGDVQGSVGGGFSYAGRNIFYGVREHAMAAISNGLAAHGGLIPFSATFLTFSDYMRPSIRLAAITEAHEIFVFTHDSIALGQDGPTHQSIEHVASLRAIPNLVVIRPADANETAEAWRFAIMAKAPVALILTRQDVPTLNREKYASAKGLHRGAYILKDADKATTDIIMIGTGSEVSLIIGAQKKLEEEHVSVRTVSMPSWEIFETQTTEYKKSIFPPSVAARLAVEAGITQGWERYSGDQGAVLGIDHFGASAPGPVVMREFGFTVESVCDKAHELLLKIQNIHKNKDLTT